VAHLEILAIPGNAAGPNPITATITYISDTVAGPAKSTVALYTSGLDNVPIKVPVKLQVSAADPKNTGTPAWTLTKPGDSKSTVITTTKDGMVAMFTPDVVGAYQVGVTLRNAAGLTSAGQYAFFNAGTYIGATAGKCVTCHSTYAAEWAKTPHATLFSRELDNMVDGPLGVKPNAVTGLITHYSETCVRCHSTGYYPAPYNGSGGYWDAKAKANWTFPTWKQIDAAFLKTGPSNWANAPAEVKNMGAIGCEVCHGPANEHVTKGAKVMEASFESGVCGQCHGAAANHSKNWQLANSKHSTGSSFEEIYGPARQACVRCHSAEGFVSFVANPKNQAAWSNEEGSISCATCHDPHSEATPYQLRIVGKPVVVPFEVKKDVGLSAVCMTCHQGRRSGDDFFAGKSTSYPHYSTAAEMLSDLGGVTYGQTLPNSPHGMMVGAAPVPNPAYDPVKAPSVAQFLWTPPGEAKGNTPGGCVFCHMWAPITSPMTDTLAFKVGGHSFNTVTPDGKTDYGASCKGCHGEVKDFNLKAKADYDGNGKVEGVQDEVTGLLNVLWKALEAKGVKKATSSPYATIPANADAKVKNAWFNFRFVYGVMWSAETGNGNEGKASAIHNFKRTVALLQASLKDLTGSLPAGMTEMK
jgi:mono/diheme cytochrome c family protein